MRLVRGRIVIVMTAALAAALATTVAPAAGSIRTTAATTIHGAAMNVNTCDTAVTPPIEPPSTSTLTVRIASDASPAPHHGQPITLSKTRTTVTIPSAFLLNGYEAGVLSNGQAIPTTVALVVAGSNTVEGTHSYPVVHSSPILTVHDPDGIPNSGDETADPLKVATSLPPTVWTPASAPLHGVHFTESSAVVTLAVLFSGTVFTQTQTCGVTAPRPFVVVDAR